MEWKKRLCAAVSVLLTVVIALAGIRLNGRFARLHSGEPLTAQQAEQGIALEGWTQTSPGTWTFTLTTAPAPDGPEDDLLTLCITGSGAFLPGSTLRPDETDRAGELYQLALAPGQSLTLQAACSREPQCWVMTPACAARGLEFRAMLQLFTLTALATMAAVIGALDHYKHRPELRYFLLYLAVLCLWGILVICFPAGALGPLQQAMRLFFSITILASFLLSAALLALALPSGWVLAASAVFLALAQLPLPALRFGVLTAGMCLCLYLLLTAQWQGYEAAFLLLVPCAVTTGFRFWALLPGLNADFFVESFPFYLIRCARVFDLPFALGCMAYVCRRFALQFDRTEQLAQELDARVLERTRALTEETEARKSMMLNIFHDLRSPLFAVSSGLDTLSDAPAALPTLLPALQQRVAFVRRLTEDLFLAAKLEQKQVLLNEDRVALEEVVAAVCSACQSEANEKGVTLCITTDKALPVWGDAVRLQQIVQNLVTNAIHYTPAGGTITATCSREGSMARVAVQDTGCGIAPEDQTAVFERYFHTTVNTKHDSTGLGLTIAQELARLHHGEITLESTVGKGSCFTLCLPLLE